MALRRSVKADLAIVGLSAIWGCTFVVTKRALADVSPLLFIAVRFAIATAVMAPLLPRAALAGAAGRSTLAGGAVTGLLLFAGFVLQTVGLQHTTPSRSAFITAMYVIFTPLLAMLLGLRRPSIDSLAGAALATIGLRLLTSPAGGGSFGAGEVLTLLCAVAFSGHLLAVDHYTRRHDRRAIAILQVAVVAVLAAAPAAVLEEPRLDPTPGALAALALCSLIATALAFYVLSLVQAWTTPTRAAIVFTAEPVFAALTSWAVEGERLGGPALAGAGLILAGMLAAEIGPLRRVRPPASA